MSKKSRQSIFVPIDRLMVLTSMASPAAARISLKCRSYFSCIHRAMPLSPPSSRHNNIFALLYNFVTLLRQALALATIAARTDDDKRHIQIFSEFLVVR